MATERKLKINVLDPDNKTKTITASDINTDTSTADLLSYSKGLIQLTDNTYISTSKIDETNLD